MSIYKDCDIRGVYDKEFSAKDCYNIGRALSTISQSAPFCVGGDLRLSTPLIKSSLIEGLVSSGSDVYDLGLIATPMMYFAIKRLNLKCGAMVTASHNPPKYNGVKFMLGDMPVTRRTIDKLQQRVSLSSYASGEGRVFERDVFPDYIESMTSRFKAKKPLKIVVDACNGSMGYVAPKVLKQCGYTVEELFCEPDGNFPNRTPNPAEYQKLTAVCERVVSTRSDIGVAFDADGDRAVFIDETGKVIISERSLVLFIRRLLNRNPSAVVYDQKSSSVVKRAILAAGGEPVPERSGHTFIKRRFLELGSAIAGEVSGHFFFGEIGYDDALFATLTLLEALSEWDCTLSQAVANVVCPPITPDMRYFCPYDKQDQTLSQVEKAFPEGVISRMDGVRIELNSGWVLARKSVTAEQITLRCEGVNEEALNAILERLKPVFDGLSE